MDVIYLASLLVPAGVELFDLQGDLIWPEP
jgi:hypothetical protein